MNVGRQEVSVLKGEASSRIFICVITSHKEEAKSIPSTSQKCEDDDLCKM